MSFEGRGCLFANEILRAATTPHLGLIPASGEREGLLEARDGGGRTGADLERTIIGRSSANKGEKTSPLAPLAGSRARGEGRWDGLGGGGRRCRLGKRVPFADEVFSCCDHPSPGPHPRKRGEGGSFGSSGWRGRTEFSRAPPGRSPLRQRWLFRHRGFPLAKPRFTPGYPSFAPPGRTG